MKFFSPILLSLACAVISSAQTPAAPATDAPSAAAPQADTKEDFQKRDVGPVPDELMVVQGTFEIAAEGENKFLQQLAEPLDDGAVLLGKSLKNGGTVKAKIKASSKRRSAPRMGVGVGGTSGYRFRLLPAEKKVELTKEDGRLVAVDFAWKPDVWFWVEISVLPDKDGKWSIQGRAWEAGQKRPEAPTISQVTEEKPPAGKASIIGTPFSQQPIQFDEIEIKPGA